jgi:hypothetical protein
MVIVYKFEEELQFAKYYAEKMNDKAVLEILKKGSVSNSNEAKKLSEFFWNMVDSSIEDHLNRINLPWQESSEYWNEKLMYSFSGYLEKAGFENEWDEISDKHG